MIEKVMNSVGRRIVNRHMQFKESNKIIVPPYKEGSKLLLYVHIPFCQSLCTYCSFNRFKFQDQKANQYFNSLIKELHMYADLGYKFESMYIGGGTPTINMGALEEIVGTVQELYPVKEISIETNPNHITDEYITRLQKMQVNRLSVGIESFDDKILKEMGRYEKYGSGQKIKEMAKNAVGKFDTLNLDLIFNMPNQTRASLEADLDALEEIKPEQVTFYPLMSSTNTTKLVENNIGKVDYNQEKEYYNVILNRIRKEFTPASAWCFSRTKTMVDEYIVDYDDYIGAGSGAFGFLNGLNYANTFDLEEYSATINQGRLPVFATKQMTQYEQNMYFMMMHLFGLEMKGKDYQAKFGRDMFKELKRELTLLKALGAVNMNGDSVTLTDKGMYYMVMAMREFFIGVNNLRDFCRPSLEELGIDTTACAK